MVFGAALYIAMLHGNHVPRHGVCLSNYRYAAGFEETIDTLHATGVAADNSGYIIFRVTPWKSRSIFSISYVLKPSSMTSR
jgi:hypothetical protein